MALCVLACPRATAPAGSSRRLRLALQWSHLGHVKVKQCGSSVRRIWRTVMAHHTVITKPLSSVHSAKTAKCVWRWSLMVFFFPHQSLCVSVAAARGSSCSFEFVSVGRIRKKKKALGLPFLDSQISFYKHPPLLLPVIHPLFPLISICSPVPGTRSPTKIKHSHTVYLQKFKQQLCRYIHTG